MNASPELSHLMVLDALGEATPEQQAELERLLAANPVLTKERTNMRETAAHLETLDPTDAPPLALPDKIRERLESARMQALAKASAMQAREGRVGNVAAFAGAAGSSSGDAKPVNRQRSRVPHFQRFLALAAAVAVMAGLLALWLDLPGGKAPAVATASPALAPRGETGMTQPTVVWDNAPGQDYNVWILPEGADQKTAPSLFVAENVRSPLDFASLKPGPANPEKDPALKPGTRYLALVCLAGGGRMAGITVPFQTTAAALGSPPSPSDAGTALAIAGQMRDAGRYADALMVLVQLPKALRDGEAVMALEKELRAELAQVKPGN